MSGIAIGRLKEVSTVTYGFFVGKIQIQSCGQYRWMEITLVLMDSIFCYGDFHIAPDIMVS